MSKHRRCDARCHTATSRTCSCWCGGLFHGVKGEEARKAFRAEFEQGIPETEEDFELLHEQPNLFNRGDTVAWRERFAKAREERILRRKAGRGRGAEPKRRAKTLGGAEARAR